MAIKDDVRARAPRGTKTVTQAFFVALDDVPEPQQAAVATAALTGIRDALKARKLKAKEAAARTKARAPAKAKAASGRAAKAAPAARRAPPAPGRAPAAKKAPAKKTAANRARRAKQAAKQVAAPAEADQE